MRILHTGDWHLGRTLEGRSRLKEQEAFWKNWRKWLMISRPI